MRRAGGRLVIVRINLEVLLAWVLAAGLLKLVLIIGGCCSGDVGQSPPPLPSPPLCFPCSLLLVLIPCTSSSSLQKVLYKVLGVNMPQKPACNNLLNKGVKLGAV